MTDIGLNTTLSQLIKRCTTERNAYGSKLTIIKFDFRPAWRPNTLDIDATSALSPRSMLNTVALLQVGQLAYQQRFQYRGFRRIKSQEGLSRPFYRPTDSMLLEHRG